VSNNKDGVVTRDKLTKHWTYWMDYWAVDFDDESRPEIIHEPRSIKTGESIPGWQRGDEFAKLVPIQQGSSIFENEWQSFRTRKDRNLELTSAPHTYRKPSLAPRAEQAFASTPS
jgi:adenine-specific DNA-methyltransferase